MLMRWHLLRWRRHTALAAVAWIWHDGIAAVEQEGENTQILLIETSS